MQKRSGISKKTFFYIEKLKLRIEEAEEDLKHAEQLYADEEYADAIQAGLGAADKLSNLSLYASIFHFRESISVITGEFQMGEEDKLKALLRFRNILDQAETFLGENDRDNAVILLKMFDSEYEVFMKCNSPNYFLGDF